MNKMLVGTFLKLYFILFLLCWGGTLQHLQKFLQCIKYIILEFTPFTLLHPSSLHS
jgi:hypothetical protein